MEVKKKGETNEQDIAPSPTLIRFRDSRHTSLPREGTEGGDQRPKRDTDDGRHGCTGYRIAEVRDGEDDERQYGGTERLDEEGVDAVIGPDPILPETRVRHFAERKMIRRYKRDRYEVIREPGVGKPAKNLSG